MTFDEWDHKLSPLSRELTFIRKGFASGTPVASVRIGTFLLGEAELSAGRKATTAWQCAAEPASRYPASTLKANAVLVEDGVVTTTGAVRSAFDLTIHLAKKTLGAQIATATARLALLSQPRASQAPFVDSGLMDFASLPSFAQSVAQWLGTRLTETYDLESAGTRFHVSTRTLLRGVQAQTGDSPLAMLQQARVDKAKQLLNGSALSIAQITEAEGYVDVPTFQRLFANRVGEMPARYRRGQVYRASTLNRLSPHLLGLQAQLGHKGIKTGVAVKFSVGNRAAHPARQCRGVILKIDGAEPVHHLCVRVHPLRLGAHLRPHSSTIVSACRLTWSSRQSFIPSQVRESSMSTSLSALAKAMREKPSRKATTPFSCSGLALSARSLRLSSNTSDGLGFASIAECISAHSSDSPWTRHRSSSAFAVCG